MNQKERDIQLKSRIPNYAEKHVEEYGHASQDLQVLWRCKGQLLPRDVTRQEGWRGRLGQQEADPQEPD